MRSSSSTSSSSRVAYPGHQRRTISSAPVMTKSFSPKTTNAMLFILLLLVMIPNLSIAMDSKSETQATCPAVDGKDEGLKPAELHHQNLNVTEVDKTMLACCLKKSMNPFLCCRDPNCMMVHLDSQGALSSTCIAKKYPQHYKLHKIEGETTIKPFNSSSAQDCCKNYLCKQIFADLEPQEPAPESTNETQTIEFIHKHAYNFLNEAEIDAFGDKLDAIDEDDKRIDITTLPKHVEMTHLTKIEANKRELSKMGLDDILARCDMNACDDHGKAYIERRFVGFDVVGVDNLTVACQDDTAMSIEYTEGTTVSKVNAQKVTFACDDTKTESKISFYVDSSVEETYSLEQINSVSRCAKRVDEIHSEEEMGGGITTGPPSVASCVSKVLGMFDDSIFTLTGCENDFNDCTAACSDNGKIIGVGEKTMETVNITCVNGDIRVYDTSVELNSVESLSCITREEQAIQAPIEEEMSGGITTGAPIVTTQTPIEEEMGDGVTTGIPSVEQTTQAPIEKEIGQSLTESSCSSKNRDLITCCSEPGCSAFKFSHEESAIRCETTQEEALTLNTQMHLSDLNGLCERATCTDIGMLESVCSDLGMELNKGAEIGVRELIKVLKDSSSDSSDILQMQCCSHKLKPIPEPHEVEFEGNENDETSLESEHVESQEECCGEPISPCCKKHNAPLVQVDILPASAAFGGCSCCHKGIGMCSCCVSGTSPIVTQSLRGQQQTQFVDGSASGIITADDISGLRSAISELAGQLGVA